MIAFTTGSLINVTRLQGQDLLMFMELYGRKVQMRFHVFKVPAAAPRKPLVRLQNVT